MGNDITDNTKTTTTKRLRKANILVMAALLLLLTLRMVGESFFTMCDDFVFM